MIGTDIVAVVLRHLYAFWIDQRSVRPLAKGEGTESDETEAVVRSGRADGRGCAGRVLVEQQELRYQPDVEQCDIEQSDIG